MKRQSKESATAGSTISLNLLALTERGMPEQKSVEVVP
jgi:hypothetical protein